MKEAGYGGKKPILLGTPEYPEMRNATVVLQAQLQAAGFNAEIESYDFPTFMERKNDYAAWDVFIASTVYQMTPPPALGLEPRVRGI